MTAKTRYFVISSLMVLSIGLGTGLVAYYVGLPAAFSSQAGPDELEFVPPDAALVAFADVQQIMQSDVRRKLYEILPSHPDGQHEFQQQTGINIETDIDRVVASIMPTFGATGQTPDGHGPAVLVLARGRFDAVKIESLMRDHGATVEDYQGSRLIVGDSNADGEGFSLSFVEPGLAAVGSTRLVRIALDLKAGGPNVTDNDEVMSLVQSLQPGNAWAVGRFDAFSGRLPVKLSELGTQLPAISWLSVSANINGGVTGVLRAEARDEEAANALRDVARGIVALAKMQLDSRAGDQVQLFTRSLALGGTGKTVSLSFDVPLELFDMIHSGATTASPMQ